MAGQVRTVGVVGSETSELAGAMGEAGLETVTGSAETVLGTGPDVVVAAGEPALTRLARRSPDSPIVPVAAGRGVRSVPREAASAAATSLADGDWTTEKHPLVAVEGVPDGGTIALFDTTVVTEEPAHISEFTVAVDGERVARFRADGVVAATPAGTRGYARAAGAPVIPPGPEVLAVVGIGPFATNLDHWVLPLGEVTITVEREEATVVVLADDREVATASVGDPIRLRRDGHVELVCLPASYSPFD